MSYLAGNDRVGTYSRLCRAVAATAAESVTATRARASVASWAADTTAVSLSDLGARAAGSLRGPRWARAGVHCGLAQTSRPIRRSRSLASLIAGVGHDRCSVMIVFHIRSTRCQAARMPIM